MAFWLLKSEPSVYSWDDLVKDRKAVWDGVANNTALLHIRAMKKGDLAFIYHTGDQRQAVGIAEMTSNPYADPKEKDERLVVVDLKPKKKLSHPVSLAAIKGDKTFTGWDFLRIGRLSVVPVPQKLWDRILEMAAAG
jgi:predicted RNA-binding protein with PUA-like domain